MEPINNFFSEVEKLLDPIVSPGTYRLYYDAHNGRPKFYTMDDLPGNYIEVSREVFAQSPSNIIVKNGKIHYQRNGVIYKLVQSSDGEKCDPRDITVITNSLYNISWARRDYDND